MPKYADIDETGYCVGVIIADEDFRPTFDEVYPGHLMIGPVDDLVPEPGPSWRYENGWWVVPEDLEGIVEPPERPDPDREPR